MLIGISTAITAQLRGGGFSPATLFANGEQGVWYAPDPDTCFTDTAGTTPAGVGDAVARMLDRSGNGNHATQPTAAARPILARVPEGGRRNLLTRTEEFDDGAWVKQSVSVTANAAVAPDGSMTADKLVATSGTTNIRYVGFAFAPGSAHTASAYFKADTTSGFDTCSIFFTVHNAEAKFNLSTGTLVATSGDITGTSIVDVGNGWFRCSASTASTSHNQIRLYVPAKAQHSTGDGTSGSYIWGAQLEEDSTATPYQRVGSTYDVTEAGKADKWHLVFDGVDDVLISNFDAFGRYNYVMSYDPSGSDFIVAHRRPESPGGWVGLGSSGSTSMSLDDNSGDQINFLVDNINPLATTRGEQYTEVQGGNVVDVLYDLTSTGVGYQIVSIGKYDNSTNVPGKVFSFVVREELDTEERTNLAAHMASKAGVTL